MKKNILLSHQITIFNNKIYWKEISFFHFNPSHAAIKIYINATAAEFICKNIFPTPVQVKKL